MNSDSLEVAGAAALWSLYCSSGFLIGSYGTLIVLKLLGRKIVVENTIGSFGMTMIFLEFIDSIPEALVISCGTIDGIIDLPFIISILFLNIVNTTASSLDILSPSGYIVINKILMSMLFFVVAMLTFSISTEIYAVGSDKFNDGEWTYVHLLLLASGTFFGFMGIFALSKYEERHKPVSNHLTELEKIKADAINEGLAANDKLMTLSSMSDSGSDILSIDTTDEETALLPASPYNYDKRSKLIGPRKSVERHIDVEWNRKVLMDQTVRVSDGLIGLFEVYLWKPSPFIEDIADYVINKMKMNFHREEKDTGFKPILLKLLLPMTGIFIMSILFVFILTYLLDRFLDSKEEIRSYIEAFAGGLSGGAFLSTISGTMIFRLQKDYYSSEWGQTTSKMVAMFCYISGIMATSLIRIIPHH